MIDPAKLPANWSKLTNYERACWLVQEKLVLTMRHAGIMVRAIQGPKSSRPYVGLGLATAKATA